jgi:hypothetical protein
MVFTIGSATFVKSIIVVKLIPCIIKTIVARSYPHEFNFFFPYSAFIPFACRLSYFTAGEDGTSQIL